MSYNYTIIVGSGGGRMIMLDISIGISCQVQTQPSIVLFKEQIIIGIKDQKYYHQKSSGIILRSTIFG